MTGWRLTLDLLLIQDNVGQPDGLGGHSDGGDASVVVRVPLQLHVDPFLSKCKIHNLSENYPVALQRVWSEKWN